MVKMMLIQYIIGCITLALLFLFAFSYQTARNQSRIDSRFALAAFLFGAEGKSAAEFEREFGTIDDFLDTFEDITRSYYAIPESSSGIFMHYTYGKDNATPIAPLVEISFHEGYYGSPAYASVLQKSFDILEDSPLGPFSYPKKLINESVPCEPKKDAVGSCYIPCRGSALGELFDRLLRVRLSFSLYSLIRGHDGTPHPRKWSAVFLFELSGHSSLMEMSVSLDSIDNHTPERLPVVISSAMLPLVVLGLLIRVYTSFRPLAPAPAPAPAAATATATAAAAATATAATATAAAAAAAAITPTTISARVEGGIPDGGRLPPRDTVVREGGWRYLGYISDVFVLSFSVTSLTAQFMSKTNASIEQAVTLLLGFATLINCIRLISILKLFPSRYVVVDGFVTAVRQLSMYSVAIFPILLGYSICGYVVFGGYGGYFGTLPLSFVSLLCATFGDNLIDTFLEMDQSVYIVQLVFSRLFIGTFLLFFICTALNVAHSIIQDSYLYAVRKYSLACREGNKQYNILNLTTEGLREVLTRLRK